MTVTDSAKQSSSSRPVVLVPHEARWAAEFENESTAVCGALGDVLVALHHIGSTAVSGILAKPVIDMLAVVTDVTILDVRSSALEQLGYEVMGEFGIPGRRYFRKDSTGGERTHQIHAFALGSAHIDRHLSFRDYLRAHPTVAAEYAELKRVLARRFSGDRVSYTDGKTEFITDVERRAAAWRKG